MLWTKPCSFVIIIGLDFHHQLKGAVLDAVDEGLIERDPTRKAIIKGKTPKAKKIKYLNQFALHTLIADLDITEGLVLQDEKIWKPLLKSLIVQKK